ncbi:MAG TPA: homoserine O-succinyltransferase [Roseiarcus sp.]|nr:homoserine O-succinyltransferase [Roseiarcus sp.]
MALEHPTSSRTRSEHGGARQVVTIGLVNNMSDEALKVTERQFGDLVNASADQGIDVELRLFALNQTPRSPRALEYIRTHYESASAVSAMIDGDLDALIITGAQPRAACLWDEVYWDELTELIDLARERTVSTIFSCLAAHAAVFHLDGLERRPLPEKCTGVFSFTTQRGHPFAGWQKRSNLIPHSRYNGLSRSDLERAGYRVLMGSPAYGVDSFTKCFGSHFLFLQGHPEYDANSLAREYRRDMGRYLRRETDRRPARPKGYFTSEAEAELDALELRAREDPSSLTMEDLSNIDALAPTAAPWRDAAISFYRNWINLIAASSRRKAANEARLARRTGRASVEAYQERLNS